MSQPKGNLLDIKAFAFDVDGVFTDGGLICDTAGELYRTYDAKDGFAVRMARLHGYPVAIITGGRSVSIRERFLTSGVDPDDIYLHSRNKIEELRKFCDRHSLSASQVLFAGDDIPDIEVMRTCGIGACPSDAVPQTIEAADWVTDRPGGKGCVREIIERIMTLQGTWTFDAVKYKEKY